MQNIGNEGEMLAVAPDTSKPIDTVIFKNTNPIHSFSISFTPMQSTPHSIYIGGNSGSESSIHFENGAFRLESKIENTYHSGAILVTVYGPHTNIVLSINAFYLPLSGSKNILITSPGHPSLNANLTTQYSEWWRTGTWTVIL